MEYKVLQYADDTTIILDGTESSLRATLKLLDVFYDISGLKINIDKTSAFWIGSKKGSDVVLCKEYKMSWVGVTHFSYLGVTLCTDLNAIVNVNYTSTMQAITKQIHHWSKRFQLYWVEYCGCQNTSLAKTESSCAIPSFPRK